MERSNGGSSVFAKNIETGKTIEFESVAYCSRVLNIRTSDIYGCISGRQKTAKKYSFIKNI
ncbi:MAG TPA: hypothetical protein VI911_11820 [Patescibacteria group bacterium]|nr:hypothetical protein [Patescibacteria group bacterium]